MVDVATVEQFITENRLDEKAAINLRAEPSHIQRAVIDRGSLADLLNPSSAVIGRIRDAKLEAKYGTSAKGGVGLASSNQPAGGIGNSTAGGSSCALTPTEVECFIQDNRLDEKAAQNLRAEPPHIQKAVIERGSLVELTNPSSAVIGRIRDAKLESKYGSSNRHGGGVGMGPGQGCAALQTSPVAPMAGMPQAMAPWPGVPATAFQMTSLQGYYGAAGAHIAYQDGSTVGLHDPAIMQHWSMYGPYAAQMQAQMMQQHAQMQAYFGQFNQGQMMHMMPGTFAATGAYPAGAGFAAFPQGAVPTTIPVVVADGHQVQTGSSPVATRHALAGEVERFIASNRLDETATRNLLAEPSQIQAAVIDRGSLAECHNPSSALIGRIRDAKLEAKYGRASPASSTQAEPVSAMVGVMGVAGTAGSSTISQEVHSFIGENRLDEKAAMNLMAEPPQIQRMVLDRGSVRDCTNPSSALIGRIRDAKLQIKYGGNSSETLPPAAAGQPHGTADGNIVDLFIAGNRIDAGAARALRAEPRDVQLAVMERGSLMACTNPSSAIMGRIRDAKLQRPPGGYSAVSTGDDRRSSPY
eukprot:TRINITY_DN23362_c0_g1_i1.p1 TRINITY_DN23362_c0_g1~~TRINITY_DN23362_c0_g1_i1.p1  ORF type:complete len:582 (-),score=98.03 TRINITY_DN23362_c0_g1_i1:77-1822(-)